MATPLPNEIVLPETKPETEWVRGRALQKVSPVYRHARLQYLLCRLLTDWAEARDCGRVGTEWRFRVQPPDDVIRPLVPDVAYLSYERLGRGEDEAAQLPLAAPNVAVEILSPGDRRADRADKIDTYLRAGCELVLEVDPRSRVLIAHDAGGPTHSGDGETFEHAALPGLRFDIRGLFDAALR